ncbi:MAG: Sensor histidine kinase RegB [Alphaproteobacteria bacterium MarineAlpha5_Bin8]|nr:MAG: Sensor histidine kinase RegB [Alphaproteobacteria bacterium MarineAlpha5_Bin7]PPR46331.1 MAG: Sensor histidine kinase RegB [Alphaproteobacteria bacterium MarineAlpha5_Bin8]PPR53177.1 MAG: Sensor histidine kinase RegB [Alphaproteobacteria bacterium MarineAlpha5_Bin6]|tara:strand:+ start:2110 stop:3372 length:1263 start_codon:yes stop_codon:yes gene_type:complete
MSDIAKLFSNNILLSNLIYIRWIAITGQFFAVLIVYYYFNIKIPLILCISAILVSIIVNLLSIYQKKINNYLSDKEAFYFLLFDTFQLAILLYLTGGIYNPFLLLLIAPIIISASYLKIIYSVLLSFLSIIIVILLNFYYIKINWLDEFTVPGLYTFGLVLSLIISLIFIAVYVYIFADSSRGISEALNETKIALSNQKKISEIGSLSAAAVHELSTPLNTIFLVLDDLKNNKIFIENIEIKKEVELIKSQAERCKEILFKLSQNPQNLKDSFFDKITLSNLIKINFDKFNRRNIELNINLVTNKKEPTIIYKDELMYGVGNIIQNAVQHCKNNILVNISWDNKNIKINIIDDGPGFSKEILDNIGNPYISSNKKNGMGLGIFIAKNLIENIGGKIIIKNNENFKGSNIEIMLNTDNLLA